MDKQFTKTVAQNIRKHRGGAYYLSAKVGGKKVRRKLDATTLRGAKIERDDILRRLRAAEGLQTGAGHLTLAEAVGRARKWYGKQDLKPNLIKYREELFGILLETCPKRPPAGWTAADVEKWWESDRVSKLSANRRNNLLGTVRKIFKILNLPDPSAEIRRVRVVQKELTVPTREEFRAIVETVRAQRKRLSDHTADMIEFLALSGVRVSEARAIHWEDIGRDFIRVRGPEGGTKNRKARNVPILAAMADLLSRMGRDDSKTGPIFQIKSPRGALDNAAERLKLPHLRVHDLRHLFATACIEAGVDVPTVAKWLGHQDGGALAMRTYGHIRDDHSLMQARKVQF